MRTRSHTFRPDSQPRAGSLSLLFGICLLLPVLQAATWRVERDGSGDFATLQPAVDGAAPGDTILIGPGRYTESTIFPYDNEFGQGETFVGVQVDSLTLIGCHRDSVNIGPDVANLQNFLPKGIAARAGFITSLTVQSMTLQNVYEGVRMRGRCTVSDYKSQDCGSAVFAGTGSMPHVRDSVVIGSVESGMTLFRTDGALIEDVSFDDGPLADNIDVIESSNVTIRRCQFAGTNIVQFQGGSTGFVDDCTFQESPTIALNLVINSNVEVRNSQFSGSGTSARSSDFSFLSGSGNLFAMNSTNTLRFTSQGGASLTNNDIRISETGYTVELSGYSINPDIIEIDLTSNYWGTTDLDSIAGEILDFNDLSGIKGIVNFEPVRTTSVPIQVRSLGELKALFRGKDD